MRLGRSVRAKFTRNASAIRRKICCPLASRQQRAKGGARCGILNYSSAQTGGKEFLGQRQSAGQPIKHQGLKFGARRTCGPQHSLYPEPGRKQVSENRRARSVAGKVCEKIGRLPVSNPRKNQFFKILKNDLERFAVFRRFRWERSAHFARCDLRKYWKRFDPLIVVSDPVHDLVSARAELFRCHMKTIFRGHRFSRQSFYDMWP